MAFLSIGIDVGIVTGFRIGKIASSVLRTLPYSNIKPSCEFNPS